MTFPTKLLAFLSYFLLTNGGMNVFLTVTGMLAVSTMMQIFMEATIIGSLMIGWFELEMVITEAEAGAEVEAQTKPSTGWFELGMVLTEVVAVAKVEAQKSFQVGETFGGGP